MGWGSLLRSSRSSRHGADTDHDNHERYEELSPPCHDAPSFVSVVLTRSMMYSADIAVKQGLPCPLQPIEQEVRPMHFTTYGGGEASVDEASWTTFRSSVRGEVVTPGDDSYDAQRHVWNAMIDRRPGAIVRCAGSADVVAAVRFAREHDLLVSVRGGGHNVAGKAVADGALMVDLSAMRSVHVDPASRPRGSPAAACGPTSTARPRPSGWPPPAGPCRTPASAGSRSAAASGGSLRCTASPATTSCRSTSSPPRATTSR